MEARRKLTVKSDGRTIAVGSVRKGVKIGDLLASVIKKMGFDPCDGCKRRQKSLNRFEV